MISRAIEQRARNIRIVDTLKKAKKAYTILVKFIVQAIDYGADATQSFTGFSVTRKERFHFAMFEKRITGFKP